MKKPPLVEVEWIDAVARVDKSCPLAAVGEVAKLARRLTCGYLVFQDAERTIIARDFDAPEEDGEEAMVGDMQVIPSGWVKTVRYKTRKRKEKTDASALQ